MIQKKLDDNNSLNNNLKLNLLTKYNKLSNQNYKTLFIQNLNSTNYSKYNYSKEYEQQNNNEKMKKSSSHKKSSVGKDKKNNIPKIRSDATTAQLNSTKDSNWDINPINNNYTNLKKDSKTSRQIYPNHQKNEKNNNGINFIRKKLIIGNNMNNSIHNKNSANKSSEQLASCENINSSGKKYIRRSNTNGNVNENGKRNIIFEVMKYKNIINILVSYIKTLKATFVKFFNKRKNEQNNKLKESEIKNKYLINENKKLKLKILELIYIMQLHNKKEQEMYAEKYNRLIKDLIKENKYLREINILDKGINSDYLNRLKNKINNEKIKKELLIHNQFTNYTEDNKMQNNICIDTNFKDNNNPFINNDATINPSNQKSSHKRQRTLFNLGQMKEEENSNSNLENMNNSGRGHIPHGEKSSSFIDNKNKSNKKEDVFCEVIKELKNYTLKKINSKKNILDNNKKENINRNNNSSNDKIINNEKNNFQNYKREQNKVENLKYNEIFVNKRQQSLYYRATKEKKK